VIGYWNLEAADKSTARIYNSPTKQQRIQVALANKTHVTFIQFCFSPISFYPGTCSWKSWKIKSKKKESRIMVPDLAKFLQ